MYGQQYANHIENNGYNFHTITFLRGGTPRLATPVFKRSKHFSYDTFRFLIKQIQLFSQHGQKGFRNGFQINIQQRQTNRVCLQAGHRILDETKSQQAGCYLSYSFYIRV